MHSEKGGAGGALQPVGRAMVTREHQVLLGSDDGDGAAMMAMGRQKAEYDKHAP